MYSSKEELLKADKLWSDINNMINDEDEGDDNILDMLSEISNSLIKPLINRHQRNYGPRVGFQCSMSRDLGHSYRSPNGPFQRQGQKLLMGEISTIRQISIMGGISTIGRVLPDDDIPMEQHMRRIFRSSPDKSAVGEIDNKTGMLDNKVGMSDSIKLYPNTIPKLFLPEPRFDSPFDANITFGYDGKLSMMIVKPEYSNVICFIETFGSMPTIDVLASVLLIYTPFRYIGSVEGDYGRCINFCASKSTIGERMLNSLKCISIIHHISVNWRYHQDKIYLNISYINGCRLVPLYIK